MIDELENRTMLAVTLAGSVLHIDGTAANETITLSQTKGKTGNYVAKIGTTPTTFAKRLVRRIIIHGGEGSDKIVIKGNGLFPKTLQIFGDGGDDTLGGSAGNDAIIGGTGNDLIRGGKGNDKLEGGENDDMLFGGPGNDKLNGDNGNDFLYGEAGNDKLFGGAGNDVLGGDDEDKLTVVGKAIPKHVVGNDLLDGGDGDDWLLNGIGNFSIQSNGGRDTLTGGLGADIIDARGDSMITDKNQQQGDFVPLVDFTPSEEGETGDVHAHIALTIQVKNKAGTYDTILIPASIGRMTATQFATIHTHSADGTIHFEAPPNSPNWTLKQIFRNWGVSFGADHIGQFRASATKPMTVTVDGDALANFVNAELPVTFDATPVLIRIG